MPFSCEVKSFSEYSSQIMRRLSSKTAPPSKHSAIFRSDHRPITCEVHNEFMSPDSTRAATKLGIRRVEREGGSDNA
jgi:hypothetical protein